MQGRRAPRSGASDCARLGPRSRLYEDQVLDTLLWVHLGEGQAQDGIGAQVLGLLSHPLARAVARGVGEESAGVWVQGSSRNGHEIVTTVDLKWPRGRSSCLDGACTNAWTRKRGLRQSMSSRGRATQLLREIGRHSGNHSVIDGN